MQTGTKPKHSGEQAYNAEFDEKTTKMSTTSMFGLNHFPVNNEINRPFSKTMQKEGIT